jgi:RimJ/RimL family protein N-acetyltransferase
MGGRSGVTGLSSIDHANGQAEFAVGIAESVMRGRGFGTDAARLMLDLGFRDLRLHRIYLDVFAFNTRAIRMYERLGFVHEATLREAEKQHGRRVDVLLMSILREEWERQVTGTQVHSQ